MTTPVNPYLTVLASDSASGAVPGAPCSRPTLRSSTSRAPVSLAVALRSCSFLKRRPMPDATVRSADCARPDDCARAGTCVQPDDCAVPGARDEGAPTEQPVEAGVRVAGGEGPRSGADEAVPGADQCADEPGVRMVDGANLRSRADEVVQGADQCAVEAGVRAAGGEQRRSRPDEVVPGADQSADASDERNRLAASADEVVPGADQCAVEAGVRAAGGEQRRSRPDEVVLGADQCADASVERNRLAASGSRSSDAEPDVHTAGNGTVVAEEGDGPVVVEQHESVPSAGREDVAGRDGAAGADPADWAADIDADLALVCAEPAPPFGVETSECVVHVDEPGDLIAGVPAMIGFAPERSLVVLVLRAVPDRDDGAIIDAVMRFDLDQEGGRGRLRAEQVARCVAQVSAHDDVAEVLAVVVDDRSVEPDLCGSDIVARCGIGRFDMLVAALARRLAAQDIALAGAWAAREIRPGERWWSLFGEQRSGLLADPATSAVALSQVLDGRPVLGSRAELAAMVTEDVALQDEVAALLDTALAIARERYARAVRRGEPDAYSRQALEYVLWQVANLESDNEPMARELAELAAALRDRTVRDAMFALAVGDHAAAAEALWAALTRALRGRDRAEAAALLGYSAYARGDGPLAGIALEAALTADPDHPMALLLETSLSLGMRPEQMRRLARSGYHAAADLGIDLGEPSM
ncbi:DUF4192 domain-containing protein [Nocardia brasiliensis]|uniref:DUF4192 domain-containing protein n=1 Tax=Nocardia brasiliensis TaxID=37326 RepID=UPI00245411A8|nr:DUF4192 domain-containing protein [Nocardia brasiliensis]